MTETSVPPDRRLLELMRGYRQPHALYLVVQLGVADLIGDKAVPATELAGTLRCHSQALARLLRALSSSGVFVERSPGVFGHTPMSELLRRDHPNTRVPSILFLGAPYTLQSWAALAHSVKTGDSAFEHVHRENKWQYNAHHPEDGAIFDRVMAGARPARIAAVLGAYDFAGASKVVDVGGGHGHLLSEVLSRHPRLRGVLHDLPAAVAQAEPLMSAAGLTERCTFESGNFLERVPPGDTYLLSDILHDWPDEQCLAILRACRAAIAPEGRLLVIEYLLWPTGTPAHVAWLDLQMLVEFGGGRQRSLEELTQLFDATGFRLEVNLPTADVNVVVASAR